jgi:hypothetical protein
MFSDISPLLLAKKKVLIMIDLAFVICSLNFPNLFSRVGFEESTYPGYPGYHFALRQGFGISPVMCKCSRFALDLTHVSVPYYTDPSTQPRIQESDALLKCRKIFSFTVYLFKNTYCNLSSFQASPCK